MLGLGYLILGFLMGWIVYDYIGIWGFLIGISGFMFLRYYIKFGVTPWRPFVDMFKGE